MALIKLTWNYENENGFVLSEQTQLKENYESLFNESILTT